MVNLLTEYSPWLILICLVVAVGYAWLLYSKDTPWSRTTNILLAVVRAVVAFCISLLLLGPYLKSVINDYEKPIVVVAVDNSSSIPMVTDSTQLEALIGSLSELAENLEAEGYSVKGQSLQDSYRADAFQQVVFQSSSTNLDAMLKGIRNTYESQNLAGIILVSDGIYNMGVSPEYSPYNLTINTIGIGDTLPQTDLNLKSIYANRIAYLENKFPLVAEIANNGFESKKAVVSLLQNGKVLERKTITFNQANGIQQVEFITEAKEKGMQRYTIRLQELKGEFTPANNYKNVYVDILDGKEKILIVAAAPHPDVRAFKAAIEKNKNYEVVTFIPTVDKPNALRKLEEEKFGLVVFHQIPNFRRIGDALLQKYLKVQTPVLFVVGRTSDLNSLNEVNSLLKLRASAQQTDLVTPSYNQKSSLFTFENTLQSTIGKFPPVPVPFGDYQLSPNAETIAYQRIGSIVTEKPLFVLSKNNTIKQGVLLGENTWRWRLQNYVLEEEHEAFDRLITKAVQYLATKEDKRRFRVYTTDSEYTDSESVVFETEVYNTIFEKIYGQKINLTLKNKEGEQRSFTYVNNLSNSRYEVKGLPEGIYSFRATTELEGKQEMATGEFTVKALQIEAINTTADFDMLRNLAQQTNGGFYTSEQLARLTQKLIDNKPPDIIHSQEKFEELINLPWLFALILFLAIAEWATRKIKGSY